MKGDEDFADMANFLSESKDIEGNLDSSTLLKRKYSTNHEVRANPRFSELFSSPASGAPTIIQLVSEPHSFRAMNFTEKKELITGLLDQIGQNIKKQFEKLQKAPANLTTFKEVESRLEKVEKEISTIKTQLEPILKLESQMEVGFTSLDNGITLLQQMLIRDREDRLNRQKEKDKRHALEQLNAKSRNTGTGAPPPTRKKTDAQQKS
ncbi:hypothetical protein GHT06_008956 [Daphnia sinensis]|uniref:Uncharacterized protein n=1 Tax=Daphnia sinensis TaxID=1820382 RepID=A0AAD5L4N1_9CRUS|nr:hypothetical protein GHT06_008956 [Daphnia sinensis]